MEAAERKKKYRAGMELMHALFKTDQTGHDGVLSVFTGMTDETGQTVFQT